MAIDYNSPNASFTESTEGLTLTGDSSTIGGQVCYLKWGPVQDITIVINEADLVDKFYLPDDDNYSWWYSCYNFLSYTNALKVVRVIDPDTAQNSGIKFKDTEAALKTPSEFTTLRNNLESVLPAVSYVNNEKIAFFGKYPALLGDSIQVAVCSYTDWATGLIDTGILFSEEFEYGPANTNQFAIYVSGYDGEVEKHIVSAVEGDTDTLGNNIFVDTYLDTNSKYIGSAIDTTNENEFYNTELTALAGGIDDVPEDGDINTLGYSMFIDKDSVEVNAMIDGGNTSDICQNYLIDNVLEVRKDCIGFLGVPFASCVNVDIGDAIDNIVAHKTNSTSYAAMYGNYKYQYDNYNNKYRWIPIGADAAGRWAANAVDLDYWFAPFGPDGAIKNCKKLAISPIKTYRDILYKAGVNPAFWHKSYSAFTFMGQKTMLAEPNDFNRIDVRLLFLYVEKAVMNIIIYYLNRKNNSFLRREHINTVTPFYDDIVGRQGIKEEDENGIGYYIQCDLDNNPASVTDAGGFTTTHFIKPQHSIEFIGINFVSTKSDINFEELLGNG